MVEDIKTSSGTIGLIISLSLLHLHKFNLRNNGTHILNPALDNPLSIREKTSQKLRTYRK